MASLRRPTLGHLLDLEGLGLLRSVGVLGAGVHLELGEHLPSEGVVRQHPLDRALDDAVGVGAQLVAHVDGFQTTGVTGVPVGTLVVPLGTGQRNLARVHDDDEVTDIEVRGVLGLVLAAQKLRGLAGQSTEHHIGGVDDVPGPGDLAGLGGVRAHGARVLFVVGKAGGIASPSTGDVATRGHQPACARQPVTIPAATP
jgi:hypothetical protein